jgi:hypothetical protein
MLKTKRHWALCILALAVACSSAVNRAGDPDENASSATTDVSAVADAGSVQSADLTRIVLLPLNVPIALPVELESGAAGTFGAIQAYLIGHGATIQVLRLSDATTFWRKAASEASAREGVSDFHVAVEALARELDRHLEFGALVIPSLVIRQADLSGRSAYWDDVRELAYAPSDESETATQTLDPAAIVAPTLPAASLHVVVANASGEILQEKTAGLALLMRLRIASGSIEEEPLPDSLADLDLVREGVVQAFSPLLAPLPASSR